MGATEAAGDEHRARVALGAALEHKVEDVRLCRAAIQTVQHEKDWLGRVVFPALWQGDIESKDFFITRGGAWRCARALGCRISPRGRAEPHALVEVGGPGGAGEGDERVEREMIARKEPASESRRMAWRGAAHSAIRPLQASRDACVPRRAAVVQPGSDGAWAPK